MVGQTPLSHDRTTARDNARHAIGRHRDIAQQHTGVDREVIDALFGLFDERVAEQLPGEVFGFAIDFFQRLINRHGADGYRRVTDDPLTGFVNVFAGR